MGERVEKLTIGYYAQHLGDGIICAPKLRIMQYTHVKTCMVKKIYIYITMLEDRHYYLHFTKETAKTH